MNSPLPTRITGTLGKLLPLLASDKAGEVLATVAAIQRTLASESLDLHDLARVVTGSTSNTAGTTNNGQDLDPVEAARFCLDSNVPYDDREIAFLVNVARLIQHGHRLTPKQARWLADLHLRARRRAAA
jgi:hypothetical protein